MNLQEAQQHVTTGISHRFCQKFNEPPPYRSCLISINHKFNEPLPIDSASSQLNKNLMSPLPMDSASSQLTTNLMSSLPIFLRDCTIGLYFAEMISMCVIRENTMIPVKIRENENEKCVNA